MFGVVLWSDQTAGKAVIWCEDHGDLAFYSRAAETMAEGGLTGTALDAGDLVEFDVRNDRDLRLASNPQVVSEKLYSDIADRLSSAHRTSAPVDASDLEGMILVRQGAPRIVPFRPRAEGQSRGGNLRIVGKGL